MPINNCSQFHYEYKYCSALLITKNVASCLSIVGCISVIFLMWIYKRNIFFTQRLVLYMTLAAMANSLSYLLSDLIDESISCSLEGLFMTYTDWLLLMWVSALVINVYINFVRMRPTHDYEWLFILVCVTFPALVSAIPLYDYKIYGPSGPWCWVSSTKPEWQIGLWYLPVLIAISAMFIIYLKVILHVRKSADTWHGFYTNNAHIRESYERDFKPLFLYPFIYLIINIFSFIPRLDHIIDPDNPKFVFHFMVTLTFPLKGAMNAIVYSLHRQQNPRMTCNEMQRSLCRCCYDENLVEDINPNNVVINE